MLYVGGDYSRWNEETGVGNTHCICMRLGSCTSTDRWSSNGNYTLNLNYDQPTVPVSWRTPTQVLASGGHAHGAGYTGNRQ